MGLIEKSVYKVVIGGTDISSALNPILIDISVSLQAGTASDTASLTIDDTDGRLRLPKDGADALIYLGSDSMSVTEIFRGKVNDIKSAGSKSGRTIAISCTGMDTKGKAKEARHKHHDNKSVSDVLKDAAKYAGISQMVVAPEIGSIVLPFALQANESFVHLGHRLSVMFGGTFKIMGDKAVMIKRNANQSASGKPLIPITAARGDNLISWDITPIIGRPRHKQTKARWYDTKKTKWVTETSQTNDDKAVASLTGRYSHNSSLHAKNRSKADAAEADRNKGEGTIEINGAPQSQPEAKCFVRGTRGGVDGEYLIDGVDHKLSRGSGFTTSLKLKQPKGSTGTDTR